MRESWDSYFMNIAKVVSTRATCPRNQLGIVITKDNRIVSTGYNGSPPGQPHCDDIGCEMVDNHCVRTVHGECNAIYQAAKLGVSLEGSTMYMHSEIYPGPPCYYCAKAIVAAGIKRVVVYDFTETAYTRTIDFFKECGIILDVVSRG